MSLYKKLCTFSLMCGLAFIAPLNNASVVASPMDAAPESLQALLEQVKQQRQQEKNELLQREQRFKQAQKQQKMLLDQARSEKLKHERTLQPLQRELEMGTQELAALRKDLQEKSQNLRDLQGAFNRIAGEVAATLKQSMVSAERPQRNADLARLAALQTLPEIGDLELLWLAMQDEMTESAKIAQYRGEYVDASGAITTAELTRVGLFTVFSRDGFLRYVPESNELLLPARQPSARYLDAVTNWSASASAMNVAVIDPTRGALINQLSHSPSVAERVEQAGLIGVIILALGGLGAIVALWRVCWLSWVSLKVNLQLKNVGTPSDKNPLGRVLIKAGGFSTDNDENYQFKLDEAVLTELPALERGQNFIKLLAAVAPLLGLLGTVTGMILTFQSISLFGNGDPKLMAGGISQALMTTVLGLVVAIPLLFSHSFVVSLSRSLVQRLDEQSAGLLVRRLEQVRAGSGRSGND